MPDKVVRMFFVPELALPAVGPRGRCSVASQQVKGGRGNAGLHAVCRDASQARECIGMKDSDRVVWIPVRMLLLTYSRAATSSHVLGVSCTARNGQRSTSAAQYHRWLGQRAL